MEWVRHLFKIFGLFYFFFLAGCSYFTFLVIQDFTTNDISLLYSVIISIALFFAYFLTWFAVSVTHWRLHREFHNNIHYIRIVFVITTIIETAVALLSVGIDSSVGYSDKESKRIYHVFLTCYFLQLSISCLPGVAAVDILAAWILSKLFGETDHRLLGNQLVGNEMFKKWKKEKVVLIVWIGWLLFMKVMLLRIVNWVNRWAWNLSDGFYDDLMIRFWNRTFWKIRDPTKKAGDIESNGEPARKVEEKKEVQNEGAKLQQTERKVEAKKEVQNEGAKLQQTERKVEAKKEVQNEGAKLQETNPIWDTIRNFFGRNWNEVQNEGVGQANTDFAIKKVVWAKEVKLAEIKARKELSMMDAAWQLEIEQMNARSKATIVYNTKVMEANWELFQKQKVAEANLYAKEQEAKGLVALAEAHATCMQKLQ